MKKTMTAQEYDDLYNDVLAKARQFVAAKNARKSNPPLVTQVVASTLVLILNKYDKGQAKLTHNPTNISKIKAVAKFLSQYHL